MPASGGYIMSQISAKVEMGPRLALFCRGRCERLPEIPQHEIEIRTTGDGAVQLGVDDAAAGFDRGVVAEIVGGFQHEPCGVDGRLVRSRSARLGVEALGLANCGAELRQHCKYSPANSRMRLSAPEARADDPGWDRRRRCSCATGRTSRRCAKSRS